LSLQLVLAIHCQNDMRQLWKKKYPLKMVSVDQSEPAPWGEILIM